MLTLCVVITVQRLYARMLNVYFEYVGHFYVYLKFYKTTARLKSRHMTNVRSFCMM